MKQDWKKYALAFIITVAILATVFWASSWANDKRLNEMRSLQDSVSINILSSETQFNLLKEAACDDLFSSSFGQELGDLGDRLSYMEAIGRSNDSDVITLKQYYSLLEIKDFLLVDSAATKCPHRPATIIYFYEANCPECARQANVLTYLREEYKNSLRVYSFDFNLDVSALRTLANIHKVATPFPALIIKDKTYNGFLSIDKIQSLLPELPVATSTNATSTHL